MISITDGVPVESSLPEDHTASELEFQQVAQSHALSLAYKELDSLRVECIRLRSLVSQLPGMASSSRRHYPTFDPDATIRPATSLRRVHSESAAQAAGSHAHFTTSLSQTSQASSQERDFISKIDQLVWRKTRDGSEVVVPSNLENLYERVSLWERAVRTRYRQRQM